MSYDTEEESRLRAVKEAQETQPRATTRKCPNCKGRAERWRSGKVTCSRCKYSSERKG